MSNFGLKQEAAGNHEAALAVLERAFQIVPSPDVKFDIARVCLKLGKVEAGQEALRFYEQNTVAATRLTGRQQADIDQLRQQLRARMAMLRVEADTPRAQVLLDGRPITLGQTVDVTAQEPHRLQGLRDSGVAEVVTLKPGEGRTVKLGIKPLPLAMPPRRLLTVGKWALAGAGLAGVVVGGTLGLLHGYQSCPQAPQCATELGTLPGSVVMLSLGGLALAGSIGLFYYDHRRSEKSLRAAAEAQ